MSNGVVDVLRAIIVGEQKSWVVFEHGTCVILREPAADLAAQASGLLKEWGPVHVGSSAADFSTINCGDALGWVVTCHHNDIFTRVSPEDAGAEPSDLTVGMYGRFKRGEDAASLRVMHIEDKRGGN